MEKSPSPDSAPKKSEAGLGNKLRSLVAGAAALGAVNAAEMPEAKAQVFFPSTTTQEVQKNFVLEKELDAFIDLMSRHSINDKFTSTERMDQQFRLFALAFEKKTPLFSGDRGRYLAGAASPQSIAEAKAIVLEKLSKLDFKDLNKDFPKNNNLFILKGVIEKIK